MSNDAITENEWAATASSIDACRQQLRECERTFEYHPDGSGNYLETAEHDADKQYLGHLIGQANLRILILLERAALPLFRQSYARGFERFEGKLDDVDQSPYDPADLLSHPLIYIDQAFDALVAMIRRRDTTEISGLALFERILRQAPYIIEDRRMVPSSEADVRKPLFDVLKTVFPDAQREVPVSHIFKIYKADLGSRQLRALSEVKYAINEVELRAQIGGIYEDIKGYSGDPHWKHFFALFYTAAPIAAPERLEAEFKLSRVDMSWIPIIVHGGGTRKSLVGKRK